MRIAVCNANPGYRLEHSIQLPDKSTEIDKVIEDEASSTVILAELKWIRKPHRTLERIARERDVARGIRQLELIRDYSQRDPEFLMHRRKLNRSLTAYNNVPYLLLVRDFWFWNEPDNKFALLDFARFSQNLERAIISKSS
jgi:hypothetical protein